MRETSMVHRVKCTLADGLSLRAALQGVQVTTAYVGKNTARLETIQLLDADGEQEWGALGNRRREERFNLEGVVQVQRPGQGEETSRATRGRAVELFAELEAYLGERPDLGALGPSLVAQVSNWEMREGATPDGRYCVIAFVIAVRCSLRAS